MINRILNIPERGIISGEREAGVSTDGQGRDVKKTGLEEVSGGDGAAVVGRDLEREDGREDGVGHEEFLVGRVL